MENLKSIKKTLIDADDNLSEAEIAIEKCKFQGTQMCDDFTIATSRKSCDWDKYRIMTDILLDYVAKVEEKIKVARESWGILWEQMENNTVETVMEQKYKDLICNIVQNLNDVEILEFIWNILSRLIEN